MAGSLRILPSGGGKKDLFTDPYLSVDDVTRLIESFVDDVEKGTEHSLHLALNNQILKHVNYNSKSCKAHMLRQINRQLIAAKVTFLFFHSKRYAPRKGLA